MPRVAAPVIALTAHTLPEETAAGAVLRKLVFGRDGVGHDDAASEVWAWWAWRA